MIKTFIDLEIEKVDKQCNDFMKELGKSCPVRTESYAVPNVDSGGTVFHKAVVFYDEPRTPEIVATHQSSMPPEKQANPDKLGALWNNIDVWKGKMNDTKISITPEIKKIMTETVTKAGEWMMIGELMGQKVRIIKNKYKTPTNKQPDFIIMKGE